MTRLEERPRREESQWSRQEQGNAQPVDFRGERSWVPGVDSSCNAAKEKASDLETQPQELSKMNPGEQNAGGEGTAHQRRGDGFWQLEQTTTLATARSSLSPAPGHQNREERRVCRPRDGSAEARREPSTAATAGPPAHPAAPRAAALLCTHVCNIHACAHTHIPAPPCIGSGRPPGKVRGLSRSG